MPSPPSVSIIVPVLNEGPLLGEFLAHVRELLPVAEVIVVDGGSCSPAPAAVASLADRILTAPPGRASQMNAGAAVAGGEVLWFLHVDSRLLPGAVEAMRDWLAQPGAVGGCFRLRFEERAWIYRVSDRLGNLGVDLFRTALGDHGIFVRSSAFHRLGGFPPVPLMEDADFYRAMVRDGRVRQLSPEITTSARRYRSRGPWRITALYLAILAGYFLNLPRQMLRQWLRRWG